MSSQEWLTVGVDKHFEASMLFQLWPCLSSAKKTSAQMHSEKMSMAIP